MDILEQEFPSVGPFSLIWKIHNFSVFLRFIDEYIFSTRFTIPLTNDSLRLLLFKNSGAKDYLSLYLHLTPSERKTKNLYEFTLSFLGSNECSRLSRSYYYCSSKKKLKNFDYWGSSKYVKWKSLMENKEKILPNDTLTVECKVEGGRYMRVLSVYSLSETLKNLYEKEKRYPSETQLKSKNSREKSQSKDNMISKKRSRIPILHEWFKHLYSGKVNSSSFQSLQNVIDDVALSKESWQNNMPKDLQCHSSLPLEKAYCTWYIRNFSCLKENEKLFSPAVRCGSSTWKMLFYLSINNNGEEIVNIFICPMSLYMNSKKIVRCKICVVDENGRFPLSVESVHLYNNDGQWKVPPFIKAKMIKGDKKSYLLNDVLVLFCSLSVSDNRYKNDQYWTVLKYYSEDSDSEYRLVNYFRQLSKDMLALFISGFCSDVKLKAGEFEVNAHKAILSERSAEFKRRIKVESKVNGGEVITLEITDLHEEHLKDLLEYIYGGISNTCFSPNFISAAIMYGVDEDSLRNRPKPVEICESGPWDKPIIFPFDYKDKYIEYKLERQSLTDSIPYQELEALRFFDYCWSDIF